MDKGTMTAISDIQQCLSEKQSFVLQGGAGSGKTETLKQAIEYMSKNFPDKKIACITHTNLAADQIRSRVGEKYSISTIHSFLNGFIKNYKKNLHHLLPRLFTLKYMERAGVDKYEGDETKQKKKEHEKYKKMYEKYASSLFTVKNERINKVEGKRVYDQDPETYNSVLNEKIKYLNIDISDQIKARDFDQISYNETRFNNFHELSYGHDGLLDISYHLFKEFPLLKQILGDKYDCIFIDEYQDTNENVIEIFLKEYLVIKQNVVGLFGDSMQAIYEDGIGEVNEYINEGVLSKIDKEDNYRCSEQVVKLINKLRNDTLEQEVALKIGENGEEENLKDRQGVVTLFYSTYENKPHSRSSKAEKDNYIEKLENLINEASKGDETYVQLKLTNKSIASDLGFETLYNIFSERFLEPQEYIEKHLVRLLFADLFDICNAYYPIGNSPPNYNLVLSKLKRQGFHLKKLSDKTEVKRKFDQIINSEKGAIETLMDAFSLGILKKSERYIQYIEQKNRLLSEIETIPNYHEFKALFFNGKNTYNKIKKDLDELEEDDFRDLKRSVQKEKFYNDLFSNSLKFKEILNYFHYMNEDTDYITMHKTKGGEIENVLVVLDEYFWTAYDFKSVFLDLGDAEKKIKNKKLVYVACSRAKTNLRCALLISDNEELKGLQKFFDEIVEV